MKNIICSVIDSPPRKWSYWRDVRSRETYLNFDKSLFPDNAYFCDEVMKNKNTHKDKEQSKKNYKNNKDFEKIEIIDRIGSPSADAEVYRIKFNNVEFALKLMPRKDDQSAKRNETEIDTAVQASRFIDYFPLTFAYGFCENSSYFLSQDNYFSSFIPEAQKFNIIYKMKSQIIDQRVKKRFSADVRNDMSIEDLQTKYGVFSDGKDIQVDYLISELANGDLGTWIKRKRELSEWRKIFIEIIYGIYYLTVEVRKVHPDLHPGNILIVQDENKPRALIHDFGRCIDVDDSIPATYKSSLLSFCQEFLSCSTRDDLIIPRDIIASVQDLQKFIETKDINGENIENVYTQFIIPIAAGTGDICFEPGDFFDSLK
mgnify:FL=1